MALSVGPVARLCAQAALLAMVFFLADALVPGFHPILLITIIGLFLMGYFFSQKLPLPAMLTPVAMALPMLIFPLMERRPDGMLYEYMITRQFDDLFAYAYLFLQDVFHFGDSLQRGGFLILLYPFIDLEAHYSQMKFVPLNLLQLAFCLMLLVPLLKTFCENHLPESVHTRVLNTTLALMLISPTFFFHTHEFLKDFIALAAVLLAAYCYLSRNYVLCALVLLFAIPIRIYTVLIVAPYLLAIVPPRRIDYLNALLYTLVIVVLVDVNFKALVNMVLSMGYVYMNPMPFRGHNWAFPTGIATFEGVVASIGLIGAAFQIGLKRFRDQGLDRLPIAIFLFGFLLIAVGYNNITRFVGDVYTIGKAGDNVFRKSLPILPLVMLQLSVTLWYTLPKLLGRKETLAAEREEPETKTL